MIESQTSETLLSDLRRGDPEAWTRAYHLYAPLVAYWCRKWGLRGADIEDVRQDVFSAVAREIHRFQRDQANSSFRGWLCGITRHKALDHLRRRATQPTAPGGETSEWLHELPAPGKDDVPSRGHAPLARALSRVRLEFHERTWTAFWRSTVEGDPPAAVAADLGVTTAAVRKARSRVLRRLREELGEPSN